MTRPKPSGTGLPSLHAPGLTDHWADMGRTRKPTALTPDRLARLYRLLQLLDKAPQGRAELLRHLKLDLRGMYRDLETLRQLGIRFKKEAGRYRLVESFDVTIRRLPFPDPKLNFQEAAQLAKGSTLAHRKLQGQIRALTK
jgi:hypothetical protein